MEVTVKALPGSSEEVEISAHADEIVPYLEDAIEKHRASITYPGFRKGKVPLEIVKKLFGESIENESLDEIANQLFRKTAEEKKLHPIGDPVMTDIDYKRGELFRFKVKYDTFPTFELNTYKGIKITKPIHTVTDEDVQAEILRLRRYNSTREDAEKIENEEYVATVDIQALDDGGTPILGQKEKDVAIYLAQEDLVPEVKNAILGSSVGSEHTVKYTIKHEEHSHEHHSLITVKKVQKVVLPEFNDEFVKKISREKMSATAEFLTSMRKDLESYWKDRSERVAFDSLQRKIVDAHQFDVPESMIKAFIDQLVEDYKNEQPGKKLPANFDSKEFEEKNHDMAKDQVKWFLLKEKIQEQEKITLDENDYEALAETEASRIGIEKERLVKFYKESKSVPEKILSKKLNNFLIAQSEITENETREQF